MNNSGFILSDLECKILEKMISDFLTNRERAGGKRTWTSKALCYKIQEFLIKTREKKVST